MLFLETKYIRSTYGVYVVELAGGPSLDLKETISRISIHIFGILNFSELHITVQDFQAWSSWLIDDYLT
jgi:hypothetical protein